MVLPESKSTGAALSDTELHAVGRMALKVDRAFGRRMDIEWACSADGLHLLQSRPLTTLPPFFPHELSAAEAEESWILSEYNRTAPLPPFARHRSAIEMWNRHLEPDDIFPRVKAKERFFNGYLYSTEWAWNGSPRGDDRTASERWLDSNESRLRREWCAQLTRLHSVNQRADYDGLHATRAIDWVRLVLEYEREEDRMHAAVWYAPQWLGLACDHLLKGFLADAGLDLKREGLPGELFQGLTCYSSERTQAAQELGRSVTEDFVGLAFQQMPLGEVVPYLQSRYADCLFLRSFTDLCRTYGVAALGSGDLQDVEGVLLVIRSSLPGVQTGARTAEEMQASAAERRRRKEDEVRIHLRARLPDQLRRFDKLLGWGQFWTPALDNRKWHGTMHMRRDYLIIRAGEALTREGLIDSPEDFRLLTRQAWFDYVKNPDPASLRRNYKRSRYDYECDRRLVPLPSLGKPLRPASPQEAEPAPDGRRASTGEEAPSGKKSVLQGQGLAPGHARGISRKVAFREKQEFTDALRSEHILVCGRDAHNAQWKRDWYSLFLVVRGLVTVGGAQLHHATQIARECGTPFVNLAEDSLDAIPDETQIEVDGREGTVTILSG